MTAKNMPYKHGLRPVRAARSTGRRCPTRSADGLSGAEAAARAIDDDRQAGRRRQPRRDRHRADPGRGRLRRPGRPASCRALAAWAGAHGIVFIADEIQSGFCRTGDWFACDHEGVVPDLVTTAKGIAGGLPLAAVTGRAEVMDAVHVGGLGGTYGGNPVACAAALGAIEEMQDPRPARPGPRRSSAIMPARLDARSQHEHPVVGDVRGRGAMMAIELVRARHHDARPGPHGRRLGVLPRPGRGHAHLRHLGQRVPLPAAARRSATTCCTRPSTSSPRRSTPPPEPPTPAPADQRAPVSASVWPPESRCASQIGIDREQRPARPRRR